MSNRQGNRQASGGPSRDTGAWKSISEPFWADRSTDRSGTGFGTPALLAGPLIRTFAQNRRFAGIVAPLLVGVIAVAALLWLSPWLVAGWAAGMLLIQVAMQLYCGAFIADSSRHSNEGWIRRFLATEFAGGLAWSGLLVIAAQVPEGGQTVDIFLFAAALIAISATTMLASTIPAVAAAGTVPVTLTLSVIYLLHQDILYVAMAILAVGVQIFFLILASRHHAVTLGLHATQAEKDTLFAELETAKAISDEARRRAEDANLAKSRFLATMSHELRTPLNAILGFSEVMEKEMMGPIANETYREYAANIHQSGTYLLDLINEVLDLSRIETGHYNLHEEPISLATLVEESVRLLHLKAQSAGQKLTENYDRNLDPVWADDRAIRQIVLNLVSNAVKFTPDKGSITVTVAAGEDGGQIVSVADNGPGIPEDELPMVLTAFGQGAVGAKNAERGVGLGLPIVQGLAAMHDCAFTVDSQAGKGTTATVAFPRSRVLSNQATARSDRPKRSVLWSRTG